jgi:hypothetical protein
MLESSDLRGLNVGRWDTQHWKAEGYMGGLWCGSYPELTQGLHDHSRDHLLQDFTVGVQSRVGVHLQ